MLKEAPNTRFTELSGYLVGFELILNNKAFSYAEKICKKRSNNLSKILTIKSGMITKAIHIGSEGIHRITGNRRVTKVSSFGYRIEGGIDELDLTDPTIDGLINQNIIPELEWLNDAVSHIYNGRVVDCIKTAFKIIEKGSHVTNYKKYKCMRDILSHRGPYQQGTINDFINEIGPNLFDFKEYDPNKGKIILDLDSIKTKKSLGKLARELITDAKRILKLK